MDKDHVLNFLMRTAEAIAITFGSNCETLIHDMSRPGHPIVAIYNGHVSGRQVGSEQDIYGTIAIPSDQMSVDMLEMKKRIIGHKDYINQMAITAHGKTVKSTTVNFIGDGYHYAIGINFDYTPFAAAMNALSGLSVIGGNLQTSITQEEENQIEVIYKECLQSMGMPLEQMKKKERIQLVTRLYEATAFSYAKSVAYIAQKMNVSRYTIYKYLHEIEETTGKSISITPEE